MSNQVQEVACSGPNYLKELSGEEIVDVEIVDGGHKYCRAVRIKLKSGKYFRIDRHMDISPYGIIPRIEYGIGAWFGPDSEEKPCCDNPDEIKCKQCQEIDQASPLNQW